MVSLLQSLALECLSQRNQNTRNILKEAGNHWAQSSCRLSLLGVCNGAGTRSDLDTLQKFVERMVMTMATMVMRNEDGNMTTVSTRSSLSSRSRSGDRGSAGWTSWLYWSCRHLQITTYIWSWLSVTLIWLITSSTLFQVGVILVDYVIFTLPGLIVLEVDLNAERNENVRDLELDWVEKKNCQCHM